MFLNVTYLKYQFTCSLFVLEFDRLFLHEEDISSFVKHHFGPWCSPIVGWFLPTFLLKHKISLHYHLSSCGIQKRIPYITPNI